MTDYSFIDPPTPKPEDERSRTNVLLVHAGLNVAAYSIVCGKPNAILQAAAETHADFQAELGIQGHHFWGRRVKELAAALPECLDFKEICAESWPWNNEEEAAAEMFNSWRQSKGHWEAANGCCDFYGYAMSLNKKRNIWYACGILANMRLRSSEGRAAVL